ncbi:unnamed protein product [Nezara viridula]|uniref:Kinetochore-associated protein 1 n=1 Tax=Nezara viridula TaxID=85310 RepID=A0A9P0HGZ2_NEZVI|nr:unnamed protein product [Nezara viridula]
MVKWDDITVGYDSNEETVNFGTRAVALTENGIYESETLATIHTSDKIECNILPHCNAIYNNKVGVSVASDKSFTLFDLKFSTVVFNKSFKDNIECFQISECGTFAFIGLQNLDFICLYLPIQEIVFSKNLASDFGCPLEDKLNFINIISRCTEDHFEVYAFVNNGLIVRVSGNNLKLVNGFNNDNYKEKIEKYNAELLYETVRKPCTIVSKFAVSNFLQVYDKNLFFIFGDSFSTWTKEDGKTDIIKLTTDHNIKKLGIPSSGNVIICLSEEGYFLLICLHTLQVITTWKKEKIKDFTFVDTVEHKTVFSNLLVITESDVPDLCLIELPVFKVKLRLKISSPSFLVYNQSSLEDILFIDGFGEIGIDTLRVKAVTESQPEFRLDRLLQRRKFSEAEKFARDLSLSLEEVYKSKVLWLMGELQLWIKTPSELITEYFQQLCSLLEEIKDVEFVAECCLKTVAPHLKMIHYLLDYAGKRLRHLKSSSDNILKLMNDVNKATVTLGTFIQISEDTTSPENWLIFCNSNPIMICLKYLSKAEISKAVIVCRRHEERIRNELPTGVAIDLFESTPLSVPVEGVLKWLKTYVPVLLKTHPDLLGHLVQWIIERTKTLELQDTSFWPDKGLNFVKDIMNIIYALPSSDPRLELPPLQENSRFAFSPIFRLTSLAKHVYELSILKSEYSISIDFDEYITTIERENGIQEVVFLILDNVSQKTIPSLISGFLKKFCTEHFLELDSLLSQYISSLARISSSWGDIESSWESRAIAFINLIKNVHHKMSAIETTVANVTVPWSAEVNMLAKYAISVDHPLAEKIYLHANNVPKKIIFKKYGLTDVHYFHVYGLIKYIYKQGYENMIEDAKQLITSTGPSAFILPYVSYLLHTTESGEIEKGIQLLKSELDSEQMEKVIERTLSYLICLLQNRYVHEHDKQFEALFILHSSLMITNSPLATELEEKIKFIYALHTLKAKYKMDVSFSSLFQSASKREMYLQEYITSLSLSDDCSKVKQITEDTCHVAYLLNLPKSQGLLSLGFYCAESHLINLGAYVARTLLKSETQFFDLHADKILEFISEFLQITISQNKIDENVGSACYNLLKKIALFCSSRNGKKVLDLISLATLSYCSKPVMVSQVFKHMYTETEITSVQPSPVLCQKVFKVNSGDKGIMGQDFIQEVESTFRDLPYNLTSIYRIQTIIWTLLPFEALTNLKQMEFLMEDKLSNVLIRVVFSRNVDLQLALSLFSLFQQENAFRWLDTYKRNQIGNLKNSSSVALVGKYYSMLTKKKFNYRTFAETYLKSEWFRKLQRFGIPPKVADSRCETHEGKRTLLLSLMNCQGIDLALIHNFCKDMSFSFQECLKLYLEHTLLTWKPKFEEVTNPKTGKSELQLLTKKDDLFLKCSQIEALIRNSDDLVDYLKKNVLQKVNFYYYEVHIVIVDLIIKLSPTHQELFRQHLQLLLFLMSYERISVLSSEETDNWFHYFPDVSTVPQISKYRLPFAPLPPDPWKIIKPELSLKTYKLWLDAPMWFSVSLDKDVICSFTIMNLKGEIPNNSEWNLHFQYKSLMNDIEECICKIKNIETAVAASYCVVNYIMPPGADRVDAAQRCYLKAQEWYSMEKSENARVGLVKAEKKYLTVSTYHILYKYQLAKPEYLSVSLQPVNLITALYHDPSIVTRTTDFTAPKPDINKAVKRIADLYDIKLTSVITELLTDWLQPNSSLNNSFDDSFAVPSSALQYSDNIIRACYILIGYSEIRQLENHLVNIAFGQDQRTKSAGTRLRALQCLRAINSNKDLEILTARDISSIRDYMLTLEFISELEKFALDYSVAGFESCSKEQIVTTLIKRSCPGAISLSAKICITYKIWNASLWESLLINMTSLSMVKVLEFSLPELSHMSDQLNEKVLISAWECLIFSLLLKVRGGNEYLEEIDRCFDLLQSCPVMSNLNLDKILLLFKELNRHDLADYLAKSKM